MNLIFLAIYIISYFLLILAPYYISYLIIEPNSFFGVVGVFILGSIIIPLTIMLATIIVSFFAKILGRSTAKVTKDYYAKIPENYYVNTVNSETRPKKNYIKIITLSFIILLVIFILFFFIKEKLYPSNVYDTSTKKEEVVKNTKQEPETDRKEESLTSESKPVIEPIFDDSNLMEVAVNNVLKIVDDEGISGVARAIRNCYVNVNSNKLYCVYFDNTAKILDTAMSNTYHFPRDQYLYDDKVIERSYRYLYKPRNITDFKIHISKIDGEIRALLLKNIRNTALNETKNEATTVENHVSTENNDVNKDASLEMNNTVQKVDSSNPIDELLLKGGNN